MKAKQPPRTSQQQAMMDAIPVLEHPEEPWPGYWKEQADEWKARAEVAEKRLEEAQTIQHSLTWNKDGYCRACGNYGSDNSHFDDCELAAALRGEEE